MRCQCACIGVRCQCACNGVRCQCACDGVWCELSTCIPVPFDHLFIAQSRWTVYIEPSYSGLSSHRLVVMLDCLHWLPGLHVTQTLMLATLLWFLLISDWLLFRVIYWLFKTSSV